MKKTLLAVTLFPLLSHAVDMTLDENIRGLPEDFRQYFYNSELNVQVYLNDNRLFDAAVALKENGKIRLLRTIDEEQFADPDIRTLWSNVLKEGVSIGKCEKNCPSGLMAVQYRLDGSLLKLYTEKYETAQVRSTYISMPEDIPGGVIMYNDVSLINTGSSRSWGINSSLISSFAGWSQRSSFQSSGTAGRYYYSTSSIYELYTQKELHGSFVRMGLFTPDSDTGNVQIYGSGYDSVIGAMWGTSDALLVNTDRVSAWPVYVTGRNQSIAEIWRDTRLIHTQQLQAGVQALDTRQLPGGIYDITIKIIENGQTVDTQQAQIYKPQGWLDLDRRWRMNFWSGQRRTLITDDSRTRENNQLFAGGGIEVLAHPRAVLGISSAATGKENQVRTRANITLSPDDTLFTQYALTNTVYETNQSTDIRYYRNISGGDSVSIFWRSTMTDVYGHRTKSHHEGSTWGSSLALRLPWSSSLIANGQYMETSWRNGFGIDVSLTTQATLCERDMNFRVNAYNRPGFNDHERDYGASFSISVSLAPVARHTISAETGMNQNQGYSSLNYQWQPSESDGIRSLGGGVSYSAQNTVINGNVYVDTPYVSGDAYVQHNTQRNTNTTGGNLNQVLVIGGGKIASVNGNNSRSMESALIVDVDSNDESASIMASGSMSETRLKVGRNIVPVELWKKDILQFSTNRGESVQIFPSADKVQMMRGSVKYISVKAVKTYTLVAMLQDEKGFLLKNRYVSSDISGGVINAEGVLTIDSGVENRKLYVRTEDELPPMKCDIPAEMKKNKRVQFFNAVKCQTAYPGDEK